MICGAGRHPPPKTDSQAGRHLLKGETYPKHHFFLRTFLTQFSARKQDVERDFLNVGGEEMNLLGNKGGIVAFCERTPSKNLGAEIIGLKM